MKPTLLVMAAGLGSRFGGVKQLAKVGPDGESILDFSIIDALAAGFGPVVMVVRSDIEGDVRSAVEARHGDIEVSYVCQDTFGPARDKPWGTLHAVLSAAELVDRPFAVINADDYYGPSSFDVAYRALSTIERGRADVITFELAKTVPPVGAVSRGLVQVVDGIVTEIVETHGCQFADRGAPDGAELDDAALMAGGVEVPYDTQCSMNLWCFDGSAMDDFASRWEAFYEADDGSDQKAECQLPTEIGVLMADGRMVVHTAESTETWIGITNPDDLELARSVLANR